MKVTIIGVDCATDPAKVGLAHGIWCDHTTTVLDAKAGHHTEPLSKTIAGWISNPIPALVAMDAPLGWPDNLGRLLAQHSAGRPLDINANDLFRRQTDQIVKATLGRQPLDVGADRIARTAHAALKLMEELRIRSGHEIPLAWHSNVAGVSAIEVYPAATLTAYGFQASGYKKKGDAEKRERIVDGLRRYVDLRADTALMVSNADVLDAGVCVLAAADFLNGQVIQPTDQAIAKKEGWIWFRDKLNLCG